MTRLISQPAPKTTLVLSKITRSIVLTAACSASIRHLVTYFSVVSGLIEWTAVKRNYPVKVKHFTALAFGTVSIVPCGALESMKIDVRR